MRDFEQTNEDHLGDWDEVSTPKQKTKQTLYED